MNWFGRLIRRQEQEHDLKREMSDHIERQVADYRRSGLTEEEARRKTSLIFHRASIQEAVLEQWGTAQLDRLWQDGRFAMRSFRKNLNFTLAIIFSLALGLGGTCAFFSVIYGVVIHPMYRDVSHIIVPTYSNPDTEGRRPVFYYSMADYLQLNKGLNSFESVIFTTSRTAVTDEAEPRNVNVLGVSPNYFQFFNTPTVVGRPFMPGDVPNGQSPPPLAVIGYKFWIKEFNGDPSIIGHDLKLSSSVYKVLGVMPRSFTWFDTDVFTPEPMRPNKDETVSVYFKLREGAALGSANAELQAVTERIAKADPEHHSRDPLYMHAEPFQDWVLGKLPGQLLILMAAVSMLLFIACGNVSVLLLARSEARMEEIGMRFALGATRGRIIRQLLTETLLLAFAGCALSVLFAWRGLPALLAALPETAVPHEAAVGLNWPVLGFAILVSLVTGLSAGLAPALRSSRNNVHATVKSGNRTTSGNRFGISTQTILVTAEIALSATLLIGCLVSIRTLLNLYHSALGYNPHHVAVLSVNLSRNPKLSWNERRAYYERLEQALAQVPGVQSVSQTFNAVPPSIEFGWRFKVPGVLETNTTEARLGLVGAEYFKTLQTPLIAGRSFTPTEMEQGAQVAVINEKLARTLLAKGKTPVGTQLQLDPFTPREDALPPKQTIFFQVIGVAATVENENLQQSSAPAIYLPYTHLLFRGITFLVRTHGSPKLLERTFQKRLHRLVDADQPVAEFDTLDHILALSPLSHAQSGATLFSIFAFVAIALASFGLYSVVSFGVAQRYKEFAIRRALGAQSGQIASIILKWMAAVTGMGIIVGILATVTFSKTLAYYEQGWRTNNLTTLLAVPALLILVSTIAVLPVIIRAISISPNNALRTQ